MPKVFQKIQYYVGLVAVIFAAQSLAQSASEGSVSVSTATSVDNSASSKASDIKKSAKEQLFFSKPLVDGKVGISLFSEDTYDGKTANNPINSYMRAYVLGNLYFSEDFYISGNFRYSSSSGDKTAGNYFLDDGSAFISELALRYDADKWSAFIGHTKINYSLAREKAAGLWGTTYVRKEVGVDGMMALGGAYTFDTGVYGNHALSGSVFMVDTTFLSDTYGTSRDPYQLSTGGPANNGKLNNYAIAVDGLKIKSLPRFRYQIGTVQMQTESLQYNITKTTTGQVDTKYLGNEQRYVLAGMWDKVPLVSNIIATPLLEYNRINNSEGISGYSKDYYIGSLLFGYKQWNLGMSAGLWNANWQKQSSTVKQFIPSNSFTNDRYNQLQVALGYVFENGLKATIGYRKENRMNNLNTQTVGVNLKYDLPFAF